MKKHYNNKAHETYNLKIFLETITALQNKVSELEKKNSELEKRIEELEFVNIEKDFKLCRENAFSIADGNAFSIPGSFDSVDIIDIFPNAQNGKYFNL